MKISTIGGNVAENSGGLRGLKYGVTRDYVMGLEVVLPSGEVIFTGNKCVKDVAGYSLRDLFIGSEGTLGIITKVLIALIPKPAARKTLLATFDQMEDAAHAVSAIIEAKIIPCTLEFLDRVTINCVEDYVKLGLPREAAAVLLMESDGHPAAVEEEAARMVEICKSLGAREVKVMMFSVLAIK
jgi:glycolate oxidase